MDRLQKYMKDKGALFEKALGNYLPRIDEEPGVLHEAMRYSVFAGGKRLRPLLVALAAEVFGAKADDALPAACAIEMVHTYSLIHDDLPAMDNDDYRRGRLSCHKAFGEALGILAGDALLTLAFETIALHAKKNQTGELVGVLALAAGSSGMVGGQVLDLEAEKAAAKAKTETAGAKAEVSKEELLSRVEGIHRRKTGALIAAALELGAIVGGALPGERAQLRDFGARIGLLFQIKDDILDVEATSEKLGKTAGKDAKAGKLTYPSILGLPGAKKYMQEVQAEALALLAPWGERANMLRLLTEFIAARES